MYLDEGATEGCIDPPGVHGNAVIAAVDGEADEDTLAHLRACPHCAARVARVRSLQRRLRRRLYRLFCPSTDVLVDYCQGLLDPHQRALITHHLAICPYCAEEMALLDRSDSGPELFACMPPSMSAARLIQ